MLSTVVCLGLASYWLTCFIRIPTDRWVQAGIKPWACNLCMSFWTTGLVGLGLLVFGLWYPPLVYLAGMGASLVFLRYNDLAVPKLPKLPGEE